MKKDSECIICGGMTSEFETFWYGLAEYAPSCEEIFVHEACKQGRNGEQLWQIHCEKLREKNTK